MRRPTRVLLILLIIVGGGLLTIQLLLHSSVKSMIATSSSSSKKQTFINNNDKSDDEKDVALQKPSTKNLGDVQQHDDDEPKQHVDVHKNKAKHSVFDDLVTVNPRDPFFVASATSDDHDENNNQQDQKELAVPSQDEDWFPEKTQKINDESKKDRWSEPALLKNYVAERTHRACGNLPSNVTITQSEDIVLGE